MRVLARAMVLWTLAIIPRPALGTLSSSDWPKFQGPAGTGKSAETGLLRAFPEGGPAILWTASLGPGFGGVAIRDGEVFLLDREIREADVLRCLDADTGEEKWSLQYEALGALPFPGSRQVPTVEEEMVYTVGGFGHVYCVDRETREEVWRLHLVDDLGGQMPWFGYSVSPLIHEDLVILAPTGEEVGLIALDRFTGDEVWRTEGLGSSHSTPVLMDLGGRLQVVFLSARADLDSLPDASEGDNPFGVPLGDRNAQQDLSDVRFEGTGLVSSFDTDTGERLWQFTGYFCSLPIPAPIQVDDERIFVTGGYQAGSILLQVKETDGEFEVKELFRNQRGAQIHQPILHEDHLYLIVNENWNMDRPHLRAEGGLLCLDLSGNEKWRTGDSPFFGRGNLMFADDLLLVQDGHKGLLTLIEPSTEAYRPLAEANVFGKNDRRDHQMWAPMALSDGRLLMRSQEELRCVDLRAVAGSK